MGISKEPPAWWHVSHGRVEDHQPAAQPYVWDNLTRPGPYGQVIVQFVLRGTLVVEWKGRSYTVTPGQGFIVVTGEDSRYRRAREGTDTACMYVRLGGAGMAAHADAIRKHGTPVLPAVGRQLKAEMRDLILHAPQWSPLETAGALHRFFCLLAEAADAGLSGVEAAIRAIKESPLRTGSLKEIAARFGISREHVTREFIRREGIAPAAWLRRVRFLRAQELLANSSLSVEEVARQSGIGCAHTLARLSRTLRGASPGTLRQGGHASR